MAPPPLERLERVVILHASSSSSSQERAFKTLEQITPGRRDCKSQMALRDEAKLVSDRRPAEEPAVIDHAKKLWVQFYGPVRKAPVRTRLDAKHRRALKTHGLAHWVRERRKHVGHIAGSVPMTTMDDTRKRALETAGPEWTDKCDKEVAFNARKRRKHMLQSITENALLKGEVSKEDRLDAEIERLRLKLVDQDREAAKERRWARGTRDIEVDLQSKAIFVDAAVDRTELGTTLAAKSMLLSDRTHATIYVVPDMASPAKRVAWACSLNGGRICAPSFVRDQGGPSLKYVAAISILRVLWISDDPHVLVTIVNFLLIVC